MSIFFSIQTFATTEFDLEPKVIINDGSGAPLYPGTSTKMLVGDMLVSPDYLKKDTGLVGHAGIVGTDYSIYEVNLGLPSQRIALNKFINKFGSAKVYVYRPKNAASGQMYLAGK
ncbi:hypothetical protein [Aquibacillus kalidii]|uniref:hypothetical protein n=1 Tax=Aquibacillus kalidii TaxID=2762597 RepID=UPI001649258E|nr:hypothetical protein [Aquibacillus kalidii]